MHFSKTKIAAVIGAAFIGMTGCTSDTTTTTPAAATDDTFNDVNLPLVSEWFANSGSNNSSTTIVDLTSVGVPQNSFATTALSGLSFTPTTAQSSMGFVATDYAGAFDGTTDWTANWTVGLHGNDNVWQPATAGTLAGATPSATGTCPTGTSLNATESSLVVDGTNSMDVCDLPATISANTTLSNDNVYRLATGFPGTKVGNGDANDGDSTNDSNVTLTIEPGTLILGGTGEALVITRGSDVVVNGSATDPVVMTSYDSRPFPGVTQTNGRGEWAGFALMGYAQTNECGTPCDVAAEGNIGYYGGTDDTDSSGSISYLVIKHAGNDIDGNGNELNGFTLFGVGNGTSIDHLQSHKGLDDGIEHFGSTDFMHHIVLTDNADDSFDWGQGYRGGAQFVVIKQADDDGDRGIEADNDHSNPVATPVSQPQLANMTLMAAANPVDSTADGILLRRGTGANIYNSIVTGFADSCIDVDEVATMDAAYNGDGVDFTTGYTGALTIDNSFVDCSTNFELQDQNLTDAQ